LLAQTAAYTSTTKLTALGWILVTLSVISAACLLVGLMTPVMAIVVILGAGALALSRLFEFPVGLIVLALAVALLGPGAFSLDARMFGRREILLPNPRPPKA
jgi:uncharacterized membrane protein YphA (DoxX/SURF4 family)